MKKLTRKAFTAAIAAAFILPGSITLAQGDFNRLQAEFIASKTRAELEISRNYLKELVALRDRAAASGNSGELTAVTAEISRIRNEITALGGNAVVPPAPVARPAAVNHIARDYVKTVKGWAGIPEFSHNNVYEFTIPEAGNQSTLTFYASGRDSVDTYGDVFILTPDGKRKKIYKWSPDDFEIPLKEVRSYKHLKPVRVDITEFVSRPGSYRIEFAYRKGDDPLGILRVEIRS